eukprot:TRINITY_DN16406_c0_g1_i1.p2 TRINITY_DN16406_c0_g1~~TRINITY_DN16406_c0_g1_i1.p2  ORF type:complete len:160 (-),score=26.29 TRINITY_DN16406_c0_g1_i1:224-658(-)
MEVKLDNFGFATRYDAEKMQILQELSIQDSPFQLGCQEDRKALGLVLMETIFCALVPEEIVESGAISQAALQRLLFDVFNSNIQEFRQYCAADPQFIQVVQFLDLFDGEGWKMLESLILNKKTSLESLLESPFLGLQLDKKAEQ